MKMQFDDIEGRGLRGLREEVAGDIVVRLDPAGFVLDASENAADVGMDLSSLLLMPHISDFAEPAYRAAVSRHVSRMLVETGGQSRDSGVGDGGAWIEFPVRTCKHRDDKTGKCGNAHSTCRNWYALGVRTARETETGKPGVLAVLRQSDRRDRESEMAAPSLKDHLTGLDSRRALEAGLRRHLENTSPAVLAVFTIDRMQAILLQYGQRIADEIGWSFARFLEAMVPVGHQLAHIDSERFAVLLSGMELREAKHWADDAVRTFGEIAEAGSSGDLRLTVSAGLAELADSVEDTLRQAELGLVMARAGGGMQAVDARHRVPAPGPAPLRTSDREG